ncbi:gag-pol polyprotein, partial [Tanacetum coccineum]
GLSMGSSRHLTFGFSALRPISRVLVFITVVLLLRPWMFLSQKKHVVEILERGHIVNCNPSRTPVNTESKLRDDGDPVFDPTLYRSLAGSLQYLTFTRPDIAYEVQQICLYMHDLREPHLSALKWILRLVSLLLGVQLQVTVYFLATTYSLGPLSVSRRFLIPVQRQSIVVLPMLLLGLVGYAIYCASCILLYLLQRLSIVIMLVLFIYPAIRFRRSVLKGSRRTKVQRDIGALMRGADQGVDFMNMSRIKLNSSVRRTLILTYILFGDLVAAGQVRVLHVPSRYQFVDIFTKGLPSTLFEDLRTRSTQGYPLVSVEVLRFYTSAGNPVKEILLKLNLPDHRILKDGGEVFTYDEVFTLKGSRDDSDKDQDPSAGSDQGTKRRKSSKEAESSRDSRSREKKSSSTSKDASQSQRKHSGKSAHAEEPSHIVDDSGVQQDQQFDTGNNDEQPANKEVSKADWFKKPERPPTLDSDWNRRQHVDSLPPQNWISQVAHAKEPRTLFNELINTSFDFSVFVLNWLNIKDLTQEILVGLKPLLLIPYHRGRQVIPQDFFINNDLEYLKGGDLSRRYSTSGMKTKATTYEIKWIKDLVHNLWSPVKDVYSRKRIIAVTRLTIMKKYDYDHLEEIKVRQDDQKLWIVIQRRVEDLQLGVESYQKKLNLTKPDTFKSTLRNRTTYTAYSNPKGMIYKDLNNRNRLMCADELQKFSDGTLDDVQTVLYDIAKGIRMEYLPKRKWSRLDKRRARVMVQDIDKQLYERRLMQNLEKFVGGREYGNDLRLLERTI